MSLIMSGDERRDIINRLNAAGGATVSVIVEGGATLTGTVAAITGSAASIRITTSDTKVWTVPFTCIVAVGGTA